MMENRWGLGYLGRDVTELLGGVGPISGVVTPGASAGLFVRVGARELIRGAPLPRGSLCAEIAIQARFVAGVAGRGHERMFGGAHVRGAKAAVHVIRGITRTAVGSGQIRDMRVREHRLLRGVLVVPGDNVRIAVVVASPYADARVL